MPTSSSTAAPSSATPHETDPLLPKRDLPEENGTSNSLKDQTSAAITAADDDDTRPWTDAVDTIKLGVPIFLAMASWVGMKLTDSALLGHVSPDALAAASLADLWTMCTAVLLQGRVLGVLTGAAIGAGNPHLAGIYLQVSIVVLFSVAGLVMLSWWCTGIIWTWFGSDPHVADMAGYYATILSISIPAQVVFGQVAQFFSSQRIMHPEVNASALALVMNLVLGLILVLGIPIPGFAGFGFAVCPMVTTTVVYVQIAVLVGVYCGLQKLHQPCWAGWDPSAWTWDRIHTFAQLYVPAALGMASDFWRVAVVGTAAARLGETAVAVFNTSYRLMWVVLIAISALASAAGIKLTLRLGRNQGKLARQAGLIGLGMATGILLVLGVLVYRNLRTLGRIFTNDPEFLEMLDDAAMPFTVTLVLMNFSVALERLPYAMGRTKEVFWYGFIASWGFQVPAVYLLTFYWRDDLTGLYTGMAIGYLALAFLYGWIVATSDWDHYARLAVERAEMPPKVDIGESLATEDIETADDVPTSEDSAMGKGMTENESLYHFSSSEIAQIRKQAAVAISKLESSLCSSECFHRYGFLKRDQFCTPTECHEMKQKMVRLVEDWNPAHSLDSFGTDDKANTARGDYFLESANKIHFFAEPTALENTADGKQTLKPHYHGIHRIEALNKVGHALHLPRDSPFGSYFRSPKLAHLVKEELGWKDPVVPQSMYIFKQGRNGGAVNSHQDSTFLFTTPRQTCLGLWLALDDATVENGCLWVRPGSQQEGVRRQYCRNPEHFGQPSVDARSNRCDGDTMTPKFVMNELDHEKSVAWEGGLPKNGWRGLYDAGFVPVECKAGDLVVFAGTLDHLSLPNLSDKARHTFQLHLVEGPEAGITWSESNWLQYPEGTPFERMA